MAPEGVATAEKPAKRKETTIPTDELEVLKASAAELQLLKDRMELAMTVEPKGRNLHCVDCHNRGRDAAMRVMRGKEDPTRDSINRS